MTPDVKICGLTREADIRAAAEPGARYGGLVFAESPRRKTTEEAVPLAERMLELGLEPVGVFVDVPPGEVLRVARIVPLRVAQLHGGEPPGACQRLRDEGLEVWKALRPRSRDELWDLTDRYRVHADALLVEGHSPKAAGGVGAGFPHGWLLDGDGERLPARVVLAGGLTPENVSEAVRRVRPEVVDVSSGVESAPGRKDPARIRAFVAAARGAGK